MYLGKIEDEYDFCNFNFNIFDKNGKKVFRVYAGCCQCGIQCMGCPCGPCETVEFEIYDSGQKLITRLIKKNKDCLKSVYSDADNFGVDFTPDMDWEHRSLLLSTILFIDYMMFEEKGNGKGNAGN